MSPFVIAKIRPASKAEAVGLQEGDVLVAVNGVRCRGLSHNTTTALMDLNDSMLTVHILRGSGAMADLTAAEQSMGPQLTVLSEEDAAALAGNKSPGVELRYGDGGPTVGSYYSDAGRQVVAPSLFGAGAHPGSTYTRDERTFNEGGTEKRTVEEKETKSFGGTTLTTVTRKEYSSFSSGGTDRPTAGGYRPRQLIEDGFGALSTNDPDWYGEHSEDRTYHSVTTGGQPRIEIRQQPPAQSKMEYVGRIVVQPSEDRTQFDDSRFGILGRATTLEDRPLAPQAAAPTVSHPWQQSQTQRAAPSPASNPVYYETEIQPGQNIVMPGFTISIEAPAGGASTARGFGGIPKPVVTVTPADGEGHVVTIGGQDGWQQQQQQQRQVPRQQDHFQAVQPPPTIRVQAGGPRQTTQVADEFQQRRVEPVRQEFQQVDRSTWQYGSAPDTTGYNNEESWNAPVKPGYGSDGSWHGPVQAKVESQRGRPEVAVVGEWVEERPTPAQVQNVQVTVGNQPHYNIKAEPVIRTPEQNIPVQAAPYYAGQPLPFNQEPVSQDSYPRQTDVVENLPAKSQTYANPRLQATLNQAVAYPASSSSPYDSNQAGTYYQNPVNQTSYAVNSVPYGSNQGSFSGNSAYPEANRSPPYAKQEPSPPAAAYPDVNKSPFATNAPYSTGSSQGPFPPAAAYPTVNKSPYAVSSPPVPVPTYSNSSQYPFPDTYQDVPPPVKPVVSFKLPVNPNFNKATFGDEQPVQQVPVPTSPPQVVRDSRYDQPPYFNQGAPVQENHYYDDRNQQVNDRPYGGPAAPNVWSPTQRNAPTDRWQGQVQGHPGAVGPDAYNPYGEHQMNAMDGYYNQPPSGPPANQPPPPPPPPVQGPPPPMPPPAPVNPFKVYGITTPSADPERKKQEEKVKLANSVAMAVMSPENAKSRGQQMYLRRRQNAHKWTTAGPDPTGAADDDSEAAQRQQFGQRLQPSAGSFGQQQQQQQSFPARPPSSGPGSFLSRSPQPERRPMTDVEGGGGRGGALFAKIRERSESIERGLNSESSGWNQVQAGGLHRQTSVPTFGQNHQPPPQQQQYQAWNPQPRMWGQSSQPSWGAAPKGVTTGPRVGISDL